jgi:predicted O-methyltransferase YrrM
VYSASQSALKFIQYFLSASNGRGHGIHSPFIYDFITRVMNDRTEYPEYAIVEKLRQALLKNDTLLSFDDYGAGSTVHRSNQRSIASIAKHSAKAPKFGQLLFRISRRYLPTNIVEMGTSLGVTSAYLGLGNKDARVFTLEGAAEVSKIARQNFEMVSAGNIRLVEGKFADTLPGVIKDLSSLDLVFVDGNHRLEPTVDYFRQMLSKINGDSILVFDDIHWSQEMEQAWDTIKQTKDVRCTIDLFFIGIVFFRPEFREKQHFTIRF